MDPQIMKRKAFINGNYECDNHMNGYTNGFSNGFSNGVSNGVTNGMENGNMNGVENGFMNGADACNGNSGFGIMPQDKAKVTEFLSEVFDLLLQEGVVKGTERKRKVVDFHHPAELKKKLELDVKEHGETDEKLLQLCSSTIKYSVKTGHPRFFNQLFCGLDPYGLAGAWLSDTINTSQYTYEVAPVFTLMEEVVLHKMAALIGLPTCDGIFCPGGSISNTYAMNLARYNKFPQIKTAGMHGLPQVAVFTSKQSHYSLMKATCLLGIGLDNLHFVPCDGRGKMIVSELERMIQEAKDQGKVPIMVNATGGTTVVGAYDPLNEIADICEKNDMWMHVDCCWGGGALLSKKYRGLLDGIHRADSVAWNPHKMMGTPLQCCAFITRHKDLLKQCHSANATYLFQKDKFYDVNYDTGDKSIQCGRKVDVFKLWLMWKAYGSQGFEDRINIAFDNAKYLAKKLVTKAGFRLVFPEPECTNVCFWYIPTRFRGQPETKEWWEELGKVAPQIKQRMMQEGTMLIGYQPLDSFVNFFRIVIFNIQQTHDDMDFVINEIDRLGHDL